MTSGTAVEAPTILDVQLGVHEAALASLRATGFREEVVADVPALAAVLALAIALALLALAVLAALVTLVVLALPAFVALALALDVEGLGMWVGVSRALHLPGL